MGPKFPAENATPPEAQLTQGPLSSELSSALSSGHSNMLRALNDSIHSVYSTSGSLSAVKACIGPKTLQAVNASIGLRAGVYAPTMDDYRLRVAQGSTGKLL